MKPLLTVLVPLSAWLATLTPATAQTVTAIVPNGAGSAFNVGTKVTTAGPVTTIDGGTLQGTNLFHSFANFQLASGETAQWVTTLTNPANVTNVINRVTGGTASDIEGTLDSTRLPNASFFFINPAGIVFGPNAQVNVPGAAYFSTAHQLNFADGSSFSAVTPQGSTLSVAAPQSFGFLGGQGDITLNAVTSLVNANGVSLSLDAGNISAGGSALNAGQLALFAVGNAQATVPLAAPAQLTGSAGAVTLANSKFVVTSANGGDGIVVSSGTLSLDNSNLGSLALDNGIGGAIRIGSGTLSLTNGSYIYANTATSGQAGSITIDAQSVTIDNAFIHSESLVCTNPPCAAAGASGDITLDAASLAMRDSGEIAASTYTGGNAGSVSVRTLTLDMATDAHLVSRTYGSGNAGAVTISASDTLSMSSGAVIDTDTAGSGNAGAVAITAGAVSLDGAPSPSGHSANITSEACDLSTCTAAGNAGSVTINTGSLSLTDGGFISTDACKSASCTTAGNAGDITLNVSQALSLSGGSLISAGTNGPGSAGSVLIAAGTVSLDGIPSSSGYSAQITSEACDLSHCTAAGNAGSVTVNTGSLSLTNGAFISTDTCAITGCTKAGNAGDIKLNVTEALSLSGGAYISSSTNGPGSAGSVSITAGSVSLDGTPSSSGYSAQITSEACDLSTCTTAGNAGSVTINTGSLNLTNGAFISTDTCDGASCTTAGNAGDIALNVTQALSLSGGADISSDTNGPGNAGSVLIAAGTVSLDGTPTPGGYVAQITSASCNLDTCTTAGNAGSVHLNTGSLILTNGAFIATDTCLGAGCTTSSGNAGEVSINVTDSLSISQDSYISSDTFGTGNAGNVIVTVAKKLTINTGASISSDSEGPGNAGAVSVSGGMISIDGLVSADGFQSYISSEACSNGNCAVTGKSGQVKITADSLSLTNGAYISSDSCSGLNCSMAGDAGGVNVKVVNGLSISGGSYISSDTDGPGNAGSVSITSGSIALDGGQSYISSSTCAQAGCSVGGNAGIIEIQTGVLNISNGSSIYTQSCASANSCQTIGNSGNINVTAENLFITQDHSVISSSSFGAGNAGIIALFAKNLEINGSSAGVFSASYGCSDHSCNGGLAGDISIRSNFIEITNGGELSTNSAFGPAGNISITMPSNGLLQLAGGSAAGQMTTSSGPQTGGVISITDPLAVISNGGLIKALGQEGGANVQITSSYFIRSTDQSNLLEGHLEQLGFRQALTA